MVVSKALQLCFGASQRTLRTEEDLMRFARHTLICLLAVAALAVGCKRAEPTLTPEAARAKGDALLQEMSKNMAAVQTFAYTSDEQREKVDRSGNKTVKRQTRKVIVRRPNGLTFTGSGDGGENAAWYDGKYLTLVSNKAKVWARGPMPATLDEALDFLSSEYAVQMATADLLYSNPYDALMTKDTTGGWVDVQKVGDRNCDHLAYKQEIVDWEIWLSPERRLPCQMKIIYKKDPGAPSTTVTYHAAEPPQVTDDTFAAKIPDDYTRIKIMRHATVNDPNVVEAPSAPAPTGTGGKKRPK
jgi:hypothetical protein